MTKLLSDRIKELHLRPNSPYPSQVRDAHELVQRWRETQRLHLVPEEPRDDEQEDDDFGGDAA